MNSYILQQNLPNAELIIYPDSGTARTTNIQVFSCVTFQHFCRLTTSGRLKQGSGPRNKENDHGKALGQNRACHGCVTRHRPRCGSGAQVLVHYGRGANEADKVVGEIRKAGGRGDAVATDLERADGPHKLAKLARDIVGDRLDRRFTMSSNL